MAGPQAPSSATRAAETAAWWAMALAIPAGATAVLIIKASHYPPLWLGASRLLLATLIIAPLAARDLKRRGEPWQRRDLLASLLPGLVLAFHFATWIIGARMVPAIDASLIGNLMPVAMPIVALVLLREFPNRAEVLAGIIGVGGISALTLMAMPTAGGRGGTQAEGDVLCGISLVAAAVYLALARRLRRGSLWIYLTPLYGIAGIVSTIAALALAGPPPPPSMREALLILSLAVVPTVIAHSIINHAITVLRPNTIGVLSLLQCPLVGLAAWLMWGEHPTAGFWVASAAVLAAFAVLMYPSLVLRLAARPA